MRNGMRLAAGVAIVGLVGFAAWRSADAPAPVAETGATGAPIVAVTLPDTLSAEAQIGERAFAANCASCHGMNAAGQNGVAPPLVHPIYEPGHHGDESFQRAVALGVRGHHWPFGDMPPVAGLSRADVGMIVAYIRTLQRANGID